MTWLSRRPWATFPVALCFMVSIDLALGALFGSHRDLADRGVSDTIQAAFLTLWICYGAKLHSRDPQEQLQGAKAGFALVGVLLLLVLLGVVASIWLH